ncbi:type II secretion system minor pseudopilin GspK [Maliponia aquimaris]|uniref:Type II secretion system protein K n=1 Tax=Maliponia aquimaris TaxID=1673631 RepID=A0A238KD89_9RHOB|nr:type II secretion system minor pseudopilin GspK [Maliponia aquimaris]SMX40795.1 General secretion pathway protein K [Maliponia aquimaris]
MTGPRGFILVNALLLVGALAAAAMVLLLRAGMSVERQAAWQATAQAEAYLDAVEALAMVRLEADPPGGPDHAAEAWADPLLAAELDRGEVSGRLEDLQGRFNVNWLAVPEDMQAHEAFDRLLVGRGLPVALGTAIRAFLAPGGPLDTSGYTAGTPATLPRGGPLRDTRQLLAVPGLTPEIFARLDPLLAALPSDTRLNVNTASVEVLDAWLPEVDAATAQALAASRARTPFASVDDFIAALSPALAATVDDSRLDIGSGWFGLAAQARLDGRTVARRSVLARHPLPVGALVDYRLPDG